MKEIISDKNDLLNKLSQLEVNFIINLQRKEVKNFFIMMDQKVKMIKKRDLDELQQKSVDIINVLNNSVKNNMGKYFIIYKLWCNI